MFLLVCFDEEFSFCVSTGLVVGDLGIEPSVRLREGVTVPS